MNGNYQNKRPHRFLKPVRSLSVSTYTSKLSLADHGNFQIQHIIVYIQGIGSIYCVLQI